jgi:hypothetical protein
MRRLFAENDEVADSLRHELTAGIEVAERREVTVQLAVRGEPYELPVEIRRELLEPILAVIASARSTARATILRDNDHARVSVFGDVAGEAPEIRDLRYVEVATMSDGGLLWVETIWQR